MRDKTLRVSVHAAPHDAIWCGVHQYTNDRAWDSVRPSLADRMYRTLIRGIYNSVSSSFRSSVNSCVGTYFLYKTLDEK